MSEDEKHDETEVEAHHGGRVVARDDEENEVEAHHGGRLVARNDEPADEQRRSEGDDEGDDEVEAHMRRIARPGRQVG